MAKKFNVVYTVAKQTTYADAAHSFVLAASLNSAVKFSPMLAPNGTVDSGATTAEYNVHRIKRVKAKVVANANAATTKSALDALDGFSKIDWASSGIATGVLKSVGTRVGMNEKFDIDNLGEGHKRAIQDSTNIQAIERHEELIEEAYTASGASAGTLAFTAGKTDVSDMINSVADEIMLLSDEFKHMTSQKNMVIILHPTVSQMVAKEIGTVYNSELPIYKTGFTSGMAINGIPVIVDPNLNKYQDADATKRLGAIVMDIESIAFKAENETKPKVVDLGISQFAGVFFYNITKAVDPARIKHLVFDATGKAAKTDKASA